MTKVISIHEYDLKDGVDVDTFQQVVEQAEELDLFQLPGLEGYHFLIGIKGKRMNALGAIWVYRSREAWENLWGSVEAPKPPATYPDNWRRWEALLEPLLKCKPDEIPLTAYQTLEY
jgi:hypothetical protein